VSIASEFGGNLELGANSVGPRDEDGVLVAGGSHVEEAPEAADGAGGAGPLGAGHERLDALHQAVPGSDIYAAALVSQPARTQNRSAKRNRNNAMDFSPDAD